MLDRFAEREHPTASTSLRPGLGLYAVGGVALCLAWASGEAGAMPVLPDFSAATFLPGAAVDNTYFPLLGGPERTYRGQKEEDGETVVESFKLSNPGFGPVILGVQTTIQRDRSFENGVIVEDTFDYYAQDTAGNVWYFGEDVTNFVYDDDGNLIETNDESAWRAGVNGALPGFIMPADLIIGFNYFQEFAPADEALDHGTIFSLGETVSLDIGEFTNVLRVLEGTALEPDVREFKYYAPGEGLILVEEDLDEDFMNPEISVALVDVPEPGSLALLLGGIGVLAFAGRRKKRAPSI